MISRSFTVQKRSEDAIGVLAFFHALMNHGVGDRHAFMGVSMHDGD